jgi:hypothetical protein
MGILDTILGVIKNQASNNAVPGVANSATGTSDNFLLETVISMITDPQSGGLNGLIEKVSAGGLGEQFGCTNGYQYS